MAHTIYALLVGINEYDQNVPLGNGAVTFPRLSGCVNDAGKIRTLLQEYAGGSPVLIQELYNQQATRENICNAFLSHLGQAGEDDQAVFYYSGHGTQETADACWKEETDGRLESLACYYDAYTSDRFLLADKELRYLIGKLAAKKAKITIIFDCCHSGDATRDAGVLDGNFANPVLKRSRGSYVFPQRRWDEFLFHREFTAQDVARKGIRTLLPEHPHVLFSAAESDQSAFEVAGEGVFTKYLINTLKGTKGFISNDSLYTRVALSMRYAYEQTPKLYTLPEEARSSFFLDGRPAPPDKNAQVFFNTAKGWIINRGELNGLTVGMEIALDPSLIARVTAVHPDHALLSVPRGTDTQKIWTADLTRLAQTPIKLHLSLESALPRDVAGLVDALVPLQPYALELVTDVMQANYTLNHLNGMFYLSQPADRYRPLAEAVAAPNFDELARQLQHISQWTFIRNISKRPAATEPLMLVEFSTGNEPLHALTMQSDGTGQIVVDQWGDADQDPSTTFRMRLTNNAGKPVYVAFLYLDANFASDASLLEQSPCFMGAGQQVDLHVDGDPTLFVDVNAEAVYYNWPKYTERFLILVSDKPFELYPLKLDPLAGPPLPGPDIALRGISGGPSARNPKPRPFEGFFTLSIDVTTVNPLYNRITGSRLSEMIDNKITGQFATGLYFTTNPGGDTGMVFTVDLELKPEITLLPEGGEPSINGNERGLVMDLANKWARNKRDKYYREITQRFPERKRIVSEGDSWFQHPLVYDIIDHLSRIYAIRCVAAAGDTLGNMLSGAKERGEYFLDVLREIKPPVFLLSGGGNDILGSQFREFLLDKPYEKRLRGNADGGKFLKPNFQLALDNLASIFDTIFTLLAGELPNMVTIVHGYDYPVHIDDERKGWLGRYMIEKGIADHKDRETVIHYILDEFNQRLAGVASKYPKTVRYLDLRGTVLFREGEIDQWYDEIHPNLEGFQAIGLKFIKLIEEVKTATPVPVMAYATA